MPHNELPAVNEVVSFNGKTKNKLISIRMLGCLTFFLALLSFARVKDAYAIVPTVVAPGYTRTNEGAQSNSLPFSPGTFGQTSVRYQQLYDASLFASSGAGFITQIIFRPDASVGAAFSSTLPDIQINLSTTSATDDNLSLTFANNVGITDTIVFARGPLSLSSAFTGSANGPKDFDIVITLTTPFFYDPSMGNLLMEVRNFGGGQTSFFDATSSFAFFDGVSRVTTSTIGNANSTVADNRDSLGLVTGFTIVPEPASAVLLFAGGGMLLAWFGRRRG